MTSHRPVVMLVQAETDDREMYDEYLQRRGFNTIAVQDASLAYRLASRADVIVTGLCRIGAMDGFEFISRLTHNSTTAAIPIIVLTASGWDDESARAAGCDALLTKPCLPERLVQEIRGVLARHGSSIPDAPPGMPPGTSVRRRLA